MVFALTLGGPALAAAPEPPPAETDAPPESPNEDAAAAQEPTEERDAAEEPLMLIQQRVRVVGNADRARKASGSVEFIGPEELARQGHTDVQRILRRVPGVNLQDEEGYGLRPNIGLRGTGVERSQRVTLMEDGVLIAPAPYAAPSAYYFPTVARMQALEISKGPASIRQGPYTTGGVLNLISHAIPQDFSGEVELAAGEDALGRGKVLVGDAGERFGWLVETFHSS